MCAHITGGSSGGPRGRGRRVRVRGARHRHRRLRTYSGRTLRRDGAQAHFWTRELPRDDAAGAALRPRRPDRAQRGRPCHRAAKRLPAMTWTTRRRVRAAVPDWPRQLREAPPSFLLGRPREYLLRQARARGGLGHGRRGADVRTRRQPRARGPAAGPAAGGEPLRRYALAEATMVHRRMGFFPARASDTATMCVAGWNRETRSARKTQSSAAEAKRVIDATFESALAGVDAILAPTTPMAATVIGESRVRINGEDETVRNALIRLNRPANITGLPSITVPCGRTAERTADRAANHRAAVFGDTVAADRAVVHR